MVALKAVESNPPIPLTSQLLVVPVIDNSTSSAVRWSENRHAPVLTEKKMSWYQRHHIQKAGDGHRWEASPHLAPNHLLREVARASIMVAGVDILKPEGVHYSELLKRNGVQVTLKEYKGAPYLALNMSGAMTTGKVMVLDVICTISDTFVAGEKSWCQRVRWQWRIVQLKANLGLRPL